jgi:hypothetical protein
MGTLYSPRLSGIMWANLVPPRRVTHSNPARPGHNFSRSTDQVPANLGGSSIMGHEGRNPAPIVTGMQRAEGLSDEGQVRGARASIPG